jgi:nitrate reductase assembly molybdenum cofactor insertion protein NarJ
MHYRVLCLLLSYPDSYLSSIESKAEEAKKELRIGAVYGQNGDVS